MKLLARRIFTVIRGLLMAAGALLLLVTFTPLVPWVARQLIVNWTDSDGDVLVVLNGGVISHSGYANGVIIGDTAYWRAIHTVSAWRGGHFRTVVLVGEHSAETLRPFLIGYGVPPSAIVVENLSTNTRQNAEFAKPVLAGLPGRKVLLTSDYHMFRAWHCFRHEGIEIIPRPFPDILKRSNALEFRWQGFWMLSGELVRIGYYRLRNWI
jgi:uncharacterized SAM-binding protein YcdF (DUF218 family)